MPLLCRNPLALGVRNERQTDRKRKKRGKWWERKKEKMGRQLSAERKSRREINKTKREGGWEGAREGDGGEAAFAKKVLRLHGRWE